MLNNILNKSDADCVSDNGVGDIMSDISFSDVGELDDKKQELFDIYINKSVKELRELLIEQNLPLSGNKTKQVHRILDNL